MFVSVIDVLDVSYLDYYFYRFFIVGDGDSGRGGPGSLESKRVLSEIEGFGVIG